MGAWGPGLYASDLGKDLKSTISSIAKLPLSPKELVDILQEAFPGPSQDEANEEYTSFWLVVADQFNKSGIYEPTVFSRATKIITSGDDLQRAEQLEMSDADQKKRKKALEELLQRIASKPEEKKRKTLSKPQPLIMSAGDVVVFPVFSHGNCINPHFSKWSQEQEGWGAACIIKVGHVFGYLAYYYPLVLASPFDLRSKPTLETLLPAGKWELRRPGTCSKQHFTRMKFEVIGNIAVDENKLSTHFSSMRDARYQAVNNISIADALMGVMGCDGSVPNLESVQSIK